jgi:predicted methyltransferase
MILSDAVDLLNGAALDLSGIWMDFDAGAGDFTAWLAEGLGPDGQVLAVHRRAVQLRLNEIGLRTHTSRAKRRNGAMATVSHRVADVDAALGLRNVDGVLMANALHTIRWQEAAVRHCLSYLRDYGTLLIVDYEAAEASPTIPYPVPFARFRRITLRAGFDRTDLLGTARTRMGSRIYAALASRQRPLHRSA